MTITKHAQVRMKQRSISPKLLQALIDFGNCRRSHSTNVLFLTREGLDDIRATWERESYKLVERKRHAYVVIGDDGFIITAAYGRHRKKVA